MRTEIQRERRIESREAQTLEHLTTISSRTFVWGGTRGLSCVATFSKVVSMTEILLINTKALDKAIDRKPSAERTAHVAANTEWCISYISHGDGQEKNNLCVN
jgi:hypothetical protein